MTQQELQYLLQIMANADIKGQHAIFHAQLMSKVALMAKEEEEKLNGNGNTQT